MDSLQNIADYLSSAQFGHAVKERARAPEPFITISREAGAGGAELAHAIAAEMRRLGYPALQGWRVWDRELCELVAREPKLNVVMDSLEREAFRGAFADYLSQLVAGTSPQAVVAHKTFQCVRLVAAAGRAIIVGRGAACAARDLGGVHLRLVAPRKLRVERLMGRYRLGRAEAEKRMDALDSDRAELVKTFFQRDVADPLLYCSVWNTGEASTSEIASVAVRLVLDRVKVAA